MYGIRSNSTDIYFHLATEEYLLKQSTENFFLLWKSDPAVVLGKHQNVHAEINLGYVQEKGIRIARRYSGGGTVYHDRGNLNLTFIETASIPDFDKFTEWILDALSAFHLNVSRDERRGIYIDGNKISGSAQCMYKNRILYHATLLYNSELDTLNAALNDGSSAPEDSGNNTRYFVRSVRSPVTNISDHLPQPTDIDCFQDLLTEHFLGRETGNKPYRFTETDLREIESLRTGKYATREWYFNTL